MTERKWQGRRTVVALNEELADLAGDSAVREADGTRSAQQNK